MRGLKLGLGLSLSLSYVRDNVLSFSGLVLPNGVSVIGSSLVSDFGSDGLIAWPAHNLISPSSTLTGSGWSGSNGGTTPNASGALPATNSTWSKSSDANLVPINAGYKLAARSKVRAADVSNQGKRIRQSVRENPSAASTVSFEVVLTADYQILSAIRTVTGANQTSGTLFLNPPTLLADCPTAYQASEPQLFLAPMSPDRFVLTTDTTANPYSPVYAECFGHFQTSGIRRGLRVKSGVDVATLSVTTNGLYDVTYFWLDTDQVTVLSQTITQIATNGLLTLSPPIGDYVLRLSISPPVMFSLDEYSVDGLVFGVSGGGLNGAGATSRARFTGQCPANKTIEARIMDSTLSTVIVDWHVIGTTTAAGSFAFKSGSGVNRIPRGENYQRQIRLQDVPNGVLSSARKFNCRDLIVCTGSSSMQNAFFNPFQASPFNQAITAAISQFKASNGNNNVDIISRANGGSVLYAANGQNNTWYYPLTGNIDDVNSWQDFGLNNLGTAYESYLLEIGGEVTAVIDASGNNDQGLTSTASQTKGYQFAQSRKFKYPESLSGRSIPFFQQELGVKFLDNVGSDNSSQSLRRAQKDMMPSYANIRLAGVSWDSELGAGDGQHLNDYTLVWSRNVRCILEGIGYTSGVQVRGPYVSSASKTGASVIRAQVTLRGGATLTPSSAMSGWRVVDNGVVMPISAVAVGAPVAGVVPVDITVSGTLVGATVLTYRYGNGVSSVAHSADTTIINPLLGKTGQDNGTYALPIEWLDDLVVV